MNIDTALEHYLICALWSSYDSYNGDGEPLDSNYGLEDIDGESIAEHREQLADFIEANAEDIEQSGMSDEMLGHDFWLTRNGHGAGFWDRGYPDGIGERLTASCKPYGSSDAYVGNDNLVYLT
jgi:hypothetical protein